MILKKIIYISVFVAIFSCNTKQKETLLPKEDQPSMSVVRKYPSAKEIRPIYKEETENWTQLKAVADFLDRFKNVSAKEILSNAIELEILVAALKKEETPDLFNTASFKARVNILHNESLRLLDMRNIPAITVAEVNAQTKKIIAAFSSLNVKINTILSKKRFEDAITIDAKYIGLDSSKIDNVSKKSINNNLQRKLEDKTTNQ